MKPLAFIRNPSCLLLRVPTEWVSRLPSTPCRLYPYWLLPMLRILRSWTTASLRMLRYPVASPRQRGVRLSETSDSCTGPRCSLEVRRGAARCDNEGSHKRTRSTESPTRGMIMDLDWSYCVDNRSRARHWQGMCGSIRGKGSQSCTAGQKQENPSPRGSGAHRARAVT